MTARARCALAAVLLSIAAGLVAHPVVAQTLQAPERGFNSSQPGETWEQGLISGNGTIGASMLSRPLDDLIVFSHERVFLPERPPLMPPDAGPRLFEIRQLIDGRTQVVDLGGRTLLPGFVDAHSHFPGAGLEAAGVDLNSPPVGAVTSTGQALGALRAKAATSASGKWILGFGYDDTLLEEERFLSRFELDEVSARSAPIGEPPRREGHILVVEDEPIVARLTREVLSGAGYRISERRNGKEALELLRRQEFDLVLSDVIMSEMSGPEMVKELQASGRSQRVLFMSGYMDDRLVAHGFDPESVPLLRKPFTASDLLESVRVALESD